MKVHAMLCEAAQARAGVLDMVGGGLGLVITRTDYPAPVNAALVLQIAFHPLDTKPYECRIVLQTAEGGGLRMDRVQLELQPGAAEWLMDGRQAVWPIVVPLYDVTVPAPGRYTFEIFIDAQHHGSVSLEVLEPAPNLQQEDDRA